jgi:O-antigen/teichoic acid export membrane protein
MSRARVAVWNDRAARLWFAAAASAVGALGGIARNKWLALHFAPAGLGVLGQLASGQTWLGTATALGLGLPVARAIGAARARADVPAIRRVTSTALGLVALTTVVTAALGIVFAPAWSAALFGTPGYAGLVRISMLAVVGIGFQGPVLGMFAGFSDVRAPVTYAVIGTLAVVGVLLVVVPRFGLAGAAWSVGLFWVAAIPLTLVFHRATYAPALQPAGPRIDPAEARPLLRLGGAALLLSVIDQGTLLALRAHYVRMAGLEANGLLQAALALAQMCGGVFYGYLSGYAFGRISGMPGVADMRAYTRRHFGPLVGLAALGFAGVAALAPPLLHLLYSNRFEGAGRMVGWMAFGELNKVAVQIWALAALPLGGVRLWVPIGASAPAGMLVGYLVARALVPPALALPCAYAGGSAFSLVVAGTMMARRGVTLRARELLVLAGALAALLAIALWRMRG